MQAWKRPPLPNASPEPANVTVTGAVGAGWSISAGAYRRPARSATALLLDEALQEAGEDPAEADVQVAPERFALGRVRPDEEPLRHRAQSPCATRPDS
jgi:hypothetical protein